MGKRAAAFAFLLLLVGGSAWGQLAGAASTTPLLSLSFTPRFTIPLGEDTALYALGGGISFQAEHRISSLPLLFIGGNLGYSYVPLQAVTSLSLIDGGITAGLRFDLRPTLSIRVFGSGGYFFAILNNGSGTGGANPMVAGGADIAWAFAPGLSIALGAAYRYCIGLYNDLAVTLGMSYGVSIAGTKMPVRSQQQNPAPAKPAPLQSAPQESPEPKGKGLIVKELSLGNVFPILHAFYDTNPIGTAVLRNTEESPITDITVSFIVRQFMDAPKDCATIAEIKPGEEKSVDLFALFKNTIFETKQSTKVPAEISLTYTLAGKEQTTTKVETLRLYDRNALSWDDTNKAAAFVMPKEPAVLMLSNQINAFVKPKMNRALDRNLQAAIAFHDALRLLGIAYVSPPLTSYAVRSQDKTAIDSVKFPLETIQYRSGDCSDLSILYCSLLESVQIETAFITIPGHIFIAFALASDEETVRKTFRSMDDFIFQDGKVWVPVEVTERESPFLGAWQTGALEWRDNVNKKQAGFYPVRKAWDTYEPVNYPGIGNQPTLPDQAQVAADFQAEVQNLITREIAARETELRAEVSRSGNSPKSLNTLGVLYGRYDLGDKATATFQAALKTGEYVPALVNLGNLQFRDARIGDALSFYQRAFKQSPHEPLVLLGLARCNQQLQNFGLVSAEYEELRNLNPELAARFAYLQAQGEESTRKAEASQMADTVAWMEDQ